MPPEVDRRPIAVAVFQASLAQSFLGFSTVFSRPRWAVFRTRHFVAIANTIHLRHVYSLRASALCSNGGAYLPFCPRCRASPPVNFRAQPVQFCTVLHARTNARTHERTYANPSPKAHDGNPCALLSTTRPALTAGPPSQRPFLSGLANCYAPCRRLCIAKRAPKFTPDSHLRPAGTGD
jgi:hypothetical protein